jgi:hypothetical protein
MLLFRLFLLPLFATFALGIIILEPPEGMSVKPGENFTVQASKSNNPCDPFVAVIT